MAAQGFSFNNLKGMFFKTDVLISSSVIIILMIMIVPFPAYLMDFFLALNVSLVAYCGAGCVLHAQTAAVRRLSRHAPHFNPIPPLSQRGYHAADSK